MFTTEGGDEALAELLDGIFRLFDADDDHFIEFNEFILLASDKSDVFTMETYQSVFDRFDEEQQGFIALACLKSLFRTINQSEEEEDEQFSGILNLFGKESESDQIPFEEFKIIVIKCFLLN
mmetsp:Transcript_42323/g.30544  ORF Transcript_42323/g.30544 Transcript_42323/m.30544 type:complete len:122 (-) Transcript_42323:357-722(-)